MIHSEARVFTEPIEGERFVLAARFGGLVTGHSQNVARLTLKRTADCLERVEGNPLGFVLLQTPKRCVANAGFFGQPIE